MSELNISSLNGLSKIIAGLLLIAATSFGISTVLAYFPNKMPDIGKGDGAWYSGPRYKLKLVQLSDTCCNNQNKTKHYLLIDSLTAKRDTLEKRLVKADSTYKKDSTVVAALKEKIRTEQNKLCLYLNANAGNENLIHLNTIILILVAAMGFLGNMIHIAASFTSFVGNGTFEKRWILWYFVKPFTAAALAVIIYFIIRAGFLGYGSDASNVNLYGIMALAALAGLFTDSATLKLKEVFDVIFKAKDERGDKLTDKIKVAQVKPDKITVAAANQFIITGENFDKRTLLIKINGVEVNAPGVKPKSIEFTYTVAEGDRDKTSFELTIQDDSGNEIYRAKIGV